MDNAVMPRFLERMPMGLVWIIVFFVVVVVNGIHSPEEAFLSLLKEFGLSDEGKETVAFVAGFTLPLTVATAVLFLLFMAKAYQLVHPYVAAIIAAVILVGAGELSRSLGLGLPPAQYGQRFPGPYGSPLTALSAYFIAYGWALATSAIAIGIASALHIGKFLLKHEFASPYD